MLRTLLKNADHIKIGMMKKIYQQLLVYIFGWPRPENYSDKSIMNTTTSKQNEEEKLTQKIEEITEVPLVEAEPRPDIQNPPNNLGPSVMTFENSGTTNEAQAIDDLARQYLKVVASRDKVGEQFLGAQMEDLGLWRDATNKRPAHSLRNVVNCKPLDDTDNPIQSKYSDDTDRFDTEDTVAEKKSEIKTKEPHPKGDTMLIDITLFSSTCPRDRPSVLKEAYEISRDSILAGTNDSKTEATQLYTACDALPEIKAHDKKIVLTELLSRVRERNQELHQCELELMSAPLSSLQSRKPGCYPPSPHINQRPIAPKVMPQIQRPCPGKKREPIKPEAPAKKDPCSKCAPVKNPSTLAFLFTPIAFPQFLPLLMCSVSPIVFYSVSKVSRAKVLIDEIKQRLFGYSEVVEKREETMKRASDKVETKGNSVG